jgi:DeoR/GlpR family transcriptional regulator of sugar metabolism
MDETQKVKEVIRSWVSLDDESRQLQTRQREIRQEKQKLSDTILSFMRDNQVDNFSLEGNGLGTISRTIRTSRPPLRRELIRTQLLLQFADQPQRVAEALRAIEGIPEGEENMSVGGTQKELLSRRIPRTKTSMSIMT